MAAAVLADLQSWITTYAGPIVDAAMLCVDAGPNGNGPMLGFDANPDQRTPLMELAHRVKLARTAGALPPAYVGARWSGAQAALVVSGWAASMANWLVAWNWPTW